MIQERLESKQKQKKLFQSLDRYSSAERDRIIHYLKQALPDHELRITKPMDPDCKVAIVIPAYSERDYLLRLPLLSLARQTGVTTKEFEVIVVINNPPSAPPRESREPASDYRKRVNYYYNSIDNNQHTLSLLRYLQSGGKENAGLTLQPHESQMCEEIIKSGLVIHVVDKSTSGRTLPMESANVGGARDRGHAEAVERFVHINRNGIIAQTDAEVRFESQHVERLVRAFHLDSDLVGVTGPPPNAEHGDTPEQVELMRLGVFSDVLMFYDGINHWKLTKSKKVVKDIQQADIAQGFDGKNMAGLAYESALAGGIPHLSGGEDPGFGKRLMNVGKIAVAEDLVIHPEPRKSTSVHSTHGVGWRLVHLEEQVKKHKTIIVRSPSHLIRSKMEVVRSAFLKAIKNPQLQKSRLKEIFKVDGKNIFNDRDINSLHACLLEYRRNVNKMGQDKRFQVLSAKIDRFVNNQKNFLIPIEKASTLLIQELCLNEQVKRSYNRRLQKLMQSGIKADASLLSEQQKLVYLQLQAMYEVFFPSRTEK